MIKDPPVASFQILKAVDDVGVNGGLNLQPAISPLFLEQVDGPHSWRPARLVIGPNTVKLNFVNFSDLNPDFDFY